MVVLYRFTEFVHIDHAAADVWAMLIDFPNVPAWEAGVLEVRQTSSGQPSVGTTFVARRVFGGRETIIDCQIVAWDAGRLVTMELKGGLVRRASVTYAVESMGERSCRVTYSTEGAMRPLLAWATPFIPAAGKRLIRGNLATLSRLLDAARVGSSPSLEQSPGAPRQVDR